MSVKAMCRRYRKQGPKKYARNKFRSHRRLLREEQKAEILNGFKGREGIRVTANPIG